MAGKACHGFGSTTQVGLTQGVRRHNQASMDSTLLTGIIGAIATIGAVVLGWYLQRPKTESPKAPSPVSPEEDASKAYARRYLEYPSHYRFRSEEHTSELQSLMRISYAVFCLKKKKHK